MAKTRKKKAGKSARRPKPARKPRKAARKARKVMKRAARPARKAARKRSRPARRPAKKAAKRVVRKAAKKKAPARKAAAPKAAAPKKAAPKKAAARGPAPTAAAPSTLKKLPRLDRERKRLADADVVPSAPSTLGYEGGSSAARSGRSAMREASTQHTETGPALTGGDVDANWEDAYAVGDEAPGGDNPTPDQDRVDDIGKALGVQYDDNEELKGAEKIQDRDRHRWELDPASSDDYVDRRKEED